MNVIMVMLSWHFSAEISIGHGRVKLIMAILYRAFGQIEFEAQPYP